MSRYRRILPGKQGFRGAFTAMLYDGSFTSYAADPRGMIGLTVQRTFSPP